jgi:hypothetical protein
MEYEWIALSCPLLKSILVYPPLRANYLKVLHISAVAPQLSFPAIDDLLTPKDTIALYLKSGP